MQPIHTVEPSRFSIWRTCTLRLLELIQPNTLQKIWKQDLEVNNMRIVINHGFACDAVFGTKRIFSYYFFSAKGHRVILYGLF